MTVVTVGEALRSVKVNAPVAPTPCSGPSESVGAAPYDRTTRRTRRE